MPVERLHDQKPNIAIALPGEFHALKTRYLDRVCHSTSMKTLSAYRAVLNAAGVFFETQLGISNIQEITESAVNIYWQALEQKYKRSSAIKNYKIVRQLLEEAIRYGIIQTNPARVIPVYRGNTSNDWPKKSRIVEAINAISTCPVNGNQQRVLQLRGNAIMHLLFDAAPRAGTLIHLNVYDPEDTTNYFQITPSGVIRYFVGDRLEQTGVERSTLEAVNDYMAVRHALARKDSPPALFLSRSGKRLNYGNLTSLVRKAGERVGLHHLTCTQMRQCRGEEIAKTLGVGAASRWLGHGCHATTKDIFHLTEADGLRHCVSELAPLAQTKGESNA